MGGGVSRDAVFHSDTEESLSSLREQAAARRGVTTTTTVVVAAAGCGPCEGVRDVLGRSFYESVSEPR